MKIIVFGATGNTGKRVLAQGIQMGHEMTAFVRNAEKLYDQLGEHSEKHVKVIVDDMMDPVSVREALVNQEAAMGDGRSRPAGYSLYGFDRQPFTRLSA